MLSSKSSRVFSCYVWVCDPFCITRCGVGLQLHPFACGRPFFCEELQPSEGNAGINLMMNLTIMGVGRGQGGKLNPPPQQAEPEEEVMWRGAAVLHSLALKCCL